MYQYIFLWDEDLEVDNFNPRRYCVIVLHDTNLMLSNLSLPSNNKKKSKDVHIRVLFIGLLNHGSGNY